MCVSMHYFPKNDIQDSAIIQQDLGKKLQETNLGMALCKSARSNLQSMLTHDLS